jgi:F-type H+-transporting ATPase subunit gamma
LLVIVSPDKGLCGGLVSNLLHSYAKYNQADKKDIYTIIVGKKAESNVARLSGKRVIASFNFGTTTPAIDVVHPIIKIIDEYYLGGKVDDVVVLYSHFKNFFSQVPTLKTLLPISLPAESVEGKSLSSLYLFEPAAKDILPSLISHHIEMSLYHFFLESFVSEQASRMIAMQNATNNAKDVIDNLKLEYNKTRQAKITAELLDITGARMASA